MKKILILSASALLLAGLDALGAIRAVTPVAWNGDPNCWQMKRHAEKMVAVTNGGAKVVFVGDSITHNWENQGKEQWRKYFSVGKYRALNLGYGGDRTEHVLWRLTEGRELDGYEAKCIVLMIGTNNSGHFPFARETPIDTIHGIREILRVIGEKQPKARVILLPIFPRGADNADPIRLRNDVVNKEIARLADGKKIIWCDFSDRFLDATGRLSRELFPDLLHPNDLGYEMWASAVLPVIDRVLAAKPGEYIPSVWPALPRTYLAGSLESQPVAGFRDVKWWNKRTLEKRNEIVDNGEIEYDAVFVGDSITHRWEREGGEGRELFAELKKTYRLLNLGYGGDRTQHVIWRLENGELEGYRAKLFMVMIGTNNGGRNIPEIAAGVKRIVADIRKRHPEAKVLLLPIFPREASANGKLRLANGKVNEIIRSYADGKDVLWLDFNAKFLEPDGTLTKKVMNDLLHPNENGYRIWWANVQPVFKQIIGK